MKCYCEPAMMERVNFLMLTVKGRDNLVKDITNYLF